MWNKTERDGKVDQAKGKVKQAVGTVVGDDTLKAEGQVDEAVGTSRSLSAVRSGRPAPWSSKPRRRRNTDTLSWRLFTTGQPPHAFSGMLPG